MANSSDQTNCDGGTSKTKNLKRSEEKTFGDVNLCTRESCKEMKDESERRFQMWTDNQKYADVTFEVGPEKVPIKAHRIILASSCPFFDNLLETGDRPLPFPELDPVAFKKILQFIYSKEISLSESTPEEIIDILRAARRFSLDRLGGLCYKSPQLQIDSDNVVEIFHLAQAKNEILLEVLTRTHIKNHTKEVFASPRFLQMTEDALCSVLKIDDWYLDEIEVFEHVKRWSSSKAAIQCRGISSGQELKAAMGQALFGIRFPLMAEAEFHRVHDKNLGLFLGKEAQEIFTYFGTSDESVLQLFVSRPRRRQPLPLKSVVDDNDVEETDPKVEIGDSDSDSSMEEEDKRVLGVVPGSVNDVNSSCLSYEPATPPPTKRARIVNPDTPVSPDVPFPTVQELIDQLKSHTRFDSSESITTVMQTALYHAHPQSRVHLPNLSNFNLRLKLGSSFQYGTNFKLHVKEMTKKLDRLLFFDKAPNASLFSSNSENNLKILLGQKVNISIHVEDCLILKVNHAEGELTMNMVSSAQEIINSLHDFPLKKLAINDCHLSSLDALRRDSLETLVINGVEGEALKRSCEFLRGCSSLREITWNNSSSGVVGDATCDIGRSLLDHNVEKLSIAAGTSYVPVMPNRASLLQRGVFPMFPLPSTRNSSLRELYLDLSSCTFVDIHYSWFPLLKRMQLRGVRVQSSFLFNAMRNESLEWIFLEGIKLEMEGVESGRLTNEARKVHNFLSKVFISDPKSEADWPTLILEKKATQDGDSDVDECYPLYASRWKGVKVTDENRDVIVRELDFKHFSYNQFYPDYETFSWVEGKDEGRNKTGFVSPSRPRLHPTLPPPSAADDDNPDETIPIFDISDSSVEENDDNDEHLPGGNSVRASLSSGPIIPETEPATQPPPAKKSRIESPRRVETSPLEKCKSIQQCVNALEKRKDKESITVIDEALNVRTIPQNRVHLPNLSEFRLRMRLNSPKRGTALRTYVRGKTKMMDRLLFFNKAAPNVNTFSSSSRERNLTILLLQNVNISIHFDDCLVLKVNRQEGELTMNLVGECGQEIIDALRDFPLKKLAINYCTLKSLRGLRRDLLETVVLTELTELEDYVEFVHGCSSLKEITCDSSEMEGNLISPQNLLDNNDALRKFCFAEGTFSSLANSKSSGRYSSLREVYLDLGSYAGELDSFFSSYPNLTRVQLTNRKVETALFYEILEIESLEWIFVEGVSLDRTEENALTDEARIVHNFLSQVFQSDPKLESDWQTLVLRKKASPSEVQPGTSKSRTGRKYDPFDASKWKGYITDENKEEILRKYGFKHFSYNQFYKDYKTYTRFEFEKEPGE